MAILDIKNLNIDYLVDDNKVRLIDNFSLTLNEGDLHLLIGESGSGKSLISRAISDMIRGECNINADRFRVNDVDMLSYGHNLKSLVSVISQNPEEAIDPSIKIYKQIYYRIKSKGNIFDFKYKIRICEDMLHRVGISDTHKVMNSYLRDLTETEARMVSIVMAVASDPVLIIADEPTSSLSSVSELQVLKFLQRLNKNYNKTILILSSNLNLLKNYSNRASFLFFGQLVETLNIEGKNIEQLINSCYHHYTYRYLSSLPRFSDVLPFQSKLYSMSEMNLSLERITNGCRYGPYCDRAQKKCMSSIYLHKLRGSTEVSCNYPINLKPFVK